MLEERVINEIGFRGDNWYLYRELLDNVLQAIINYYKNIHDNDNVNLRDWPREQIGFPELQLNAQFYEKVEDWFGRKNYSIIRDENNTRRFIVSFISAAGFPPQLGFVTIISKILSFFDWEDLYEYSDNYIDETQKEIVNKLSRKVHKILVESREGFIALKKLVKFLATYKHKLANNINNALGETLEAFTDFKHCAQELISQYGRLLDIPGTQSRVKKLEIGYELDVNRWNIILKSNINNGGVIISTEMEGEVLLEWQGKGSKDIHFKISNSILRSEKDKGFNFELDIKILRDTFIEAETFNLPIYIKSKNTDKTEILTVIQREIPYLVFDSEGKELVGMEIDVELNKLIYIIPLTKEAFITLKDNSIVTRNQNEDNRLLSFQCMSENELHITIDDKLSINFTLRPFQIDFSHTLNQFISPAFKMGNFRQNWYQIKAMMNSQVNFHCSIFDSKNYETNITEINNRAPGKYYLSVTHPETKVQKKKYFYILPDFEVEENSEHVKLISHEENYYFKIQSDDLEDIGDGVWQPKKQRKISAHIVLYEKNATSPLFKLSIPFNCTRDIVFYKRLLSDEIENKEKLKLSDIKESGSIVIQKGKEIKLEIIPQMPRHHFQQFYIEKYSGKGPFYWDKIKEIIKKHNSKECEIILYRHEEVKSFSRFKNLEKEKSFFRFTILNDKLYTLNNLEDKLTFEPEIETDRLNNFSLRLFNILCLQEEYREITIYEDDINNIPDGLWMIYLVKKENNFDMENDGNKAKSQIVSQGLFYSKGSIELKDLNKLQKLLYELKPYSISEFHQIGEEFEASYLKNKEQSQVIVQVFNNITQNSSNPEDFLIYSLLPEQFPLLAAWWLFANNPDTNTHFCGEKSLNIDIFNNHPRFIWELIRIKDIDWLKNNQLFLRDERELLIIENLFSNQKYLEVCDNLYWIRFAYLHHLSTNINNDNFKKACKNSLKESLDKFYDKSLPLKMSEQKYQQIKRGMGENYQEILETAYKMILDVDERDKSTTGLQQNDILGLLIRIVEFESNLSEVLYNKIIEQINVIFNDAATNFKIPNRLSNKEYDVMFNRITNDEDKLLFQNSFIYENEFDDYLKFQEKNSKKITQIFQIYNLTWQLEGKNISDVNGINRIITQSLVNDIDFEVLADYFKTFLTNMRFKVNNNYRISNTDRIKILCAMITYDLVCYQLGLDGKRCFKNPTVVMVVAGVLKKNVKKLFNLWYSEWMFALVDKKYGLLINRGIL